MENVQFILTEPGYTLQHEMYQLPVLIGNRCSERPLSPYLRKRTGCGHSKRRPTLPIRTFVEALVENFLTSCLVSLYIDKQQPMDQHVNLLLPWMETMYARLNLSLVFFAKQCICHSAPYRRS